MKRSLPIRGTLLNTATVAVGALIGLALGSRVPESWLNIALTGMGLVTIGMGIKMFLLSRNVLIVALAIGLGGILGSILGIEVGLDNLAEMVRAKFGGGDRFNEGLITASVLFCVGPVTLLGCIQDGIEGKIELLALKSTMDGITAVFLAAALGVGVLVTAGVVLVVQGTLTLLAKPAAPLARDEPLMAEASAAGGILLAMIGLGLASIKKIPAATYLPALVIAPMIVLVARRFVREPA